MNKTLTLGEVASLVDGELRGDANVRIRSVAPVTTAGPGDITWITEHKYARHLNQCRASAVLLKPDMADGSIPAVSCRRPDLAIALVLERLSPPLPHPQPGIDPTAIIAEDASIEADCAIGPRVVLQCGVRVGHRTIVHAGVFIGRESTLGDDCVIWPNTVIRERCHLGHRVIVHPNSTIGADGFGYNLDQGRYRRIAHIGGVRIEDDVEIGANSCIDRAKCGETVVGRGTKIDNLVQVAHNVRIGEDCCIIAHVGIAGSAVLGNHVLLAGKVGIKDNVQIGDGVQAAACSCIAGDIEDGQIVLGIPAISKAAYFKEHASLRRLPRAIQQIRDLIRRVRRLEAADHPKDG